MTRSATMFDKMEFPQYVFVEYPKMLYKHGGGSVTVASVEEEKKLVGDWFTVPGEALEETN